MGKGMKRWTLIEIALIVVIMMDAALLFSYQAHPGLPANIIGCAPFLIGEDDALLQLKEGDLMIAAVGNVSANTGDVICYQDGEKIGMGKVIQSSKTWYQVENRYGRSYIAARQTVGRRVMRIPCVGAVIIFIAEHMWWLMSVTAGYLVVELWRSRKEEIQEKGSE